MEECWAKGNKCRPPVDQCLTKRRHRCGHVGSCGAGIRTWSPPSPRVAALPPTLRSDQKPSSEVVAKVLSGSEKLVFT